MVSYHNTQRKKDEQVHNKLSATCTIIMLYPLVPPVEYCGMEMFCGVFNTNLSCANKIETVRLFPLVILVMFQKTSVSSGLRYGIKTSSAVWRQVPLNLLRVESDCLGRFLTPMLHSNEGHS